jgi:hypothetical protein
MYYRWLRIVPAGTREDHDAITRAPSHPLMTDDLPEGELGKYIVFAATLEIFMDSYVAKFY